MKAVCNLRYVILSLYLSFCVHSFMHLFAKISLFSLLFLSSLPLTVFSSSLRSDVASSLNGEGIARQHDMLQKVLQFEGTIVRLVFS